MKDIKTFLLTLKQPLRAPTDDDKKAHAEHLTALWKAGQLRLCGRLPGSGGAIQVLTVRDEDAARDAAGRDPFVSRGVYGSFTVEEFQEALPEKDFVL